MAAPQFAVFRMSDYAQSQLDLIELFTWPPVSAPDAQSETTRLADSPKSPAVDRLPAPSSIRQTSVGHVDRDQQGEHGIGSHFAGREDAPQNIGSE
jgi:hypothetical protein